MERWPFRLVDVFTERPLAGNQLAVFEDAADIPESLLQPLAQEMMLTNRLPQASSLTLA